MEHLLYGHVQAEEARAGPVGAPRRAQDAVAGPLFRTDIVNFPNVPAFAAPNQSRGDGNFGRIGGGLGGSTGWEIQISLRLAW